MIKDKFAKFFESSIDDILYDYELAEFTKNVVLNNRTSIPALFRYSPADYYNIRGLETQTAQESILALTGAITAMKAERKGLESVSAAKEKLSGEKQTGHLPFFV